MDSKDETTVFEFIRTFWPGLAANCWQGFQTIGRGAILVQRKDIEGFATRPGPRTLQYVQPGGPPEITSLVDRYDPTKEIVVLVTGFGTGGAYIVRGSEIGLPDPPDADPDLRKAPPPSACG